MNIIPFKRKISKKFIGCGIDKLYSNFFKQKISMFLISYIDKFLFLIKISFNVFNGGIIPSISLNLIDNNKHPKAIFSISKFNFFVNNLSKK